MYQCTLNVIQTNSLSRSVPSWISAQLNGHGEINMKIKSDSLDQLLNLYFVSCGSNGYSNAQYVVCA